MKTHSLVGRFIMVKLSNLPQIIYYYNEISSKILQDFLQAVSDLF